MQVLTLLISSVILHVEQDKSNAPGFFPGNFIHIRSIYDSPGDLSPERTDRSSGTLQTII